MKILYAIKQRLVTSLLIAMVIGFIIGLWVDTSTLRPLVTVLSVMMVYPMMVTLQYKSLLTRGNTKLQVVAQLINFIYLPLMAVAFGLIFFRHEIYYRLALLLIALLPTSGMTVSWTVMAKGNVQAAIKMIVIGLLLGGLLTPFYLNFFLGESIQIPFTTIFGQIVMIVFLPMLLGFLTQILLIKRYSETVFRQTIKPIFPLFSNLALVSLMVLVMSLRAQLLIANQSLIPRIIVPLFLGYFLMMVTIHFIGKHLFNRDDRIALVNGTMIRSLTLALAIALTLFSAQGPEMALIIAIAFVIQVQLAAFYVKREMKHQA